MVVMMAGRMDVAWMRDKPEVMIQLMLWGIARRRGTRVPSA